MASPIFDNVKLQENLLGKAGSKVETVLRLETWYNKLLVEVFHTQPEQRYVLKKLLAFGSPIMKEQNSGIGGTAADRKIKITIPVPAEHKVNEINYGVLDAGNQYVSGMRHISCDFAKFSINTAMVEDDLREVSVAQKIIETNIADAGEMYHAHQEKLIIEKLVDPTTAIEKMYPGALLNVDAVHDAAGDTGKLTLAMFQQAVLDFRTNTIETTGGAAKTLTNPIRGYKNGKYYLAIITPTQVGTLLQDATFEKFFNKDGSGVLEEARDFELVSTYLGIKFAVSTAQILVAGTGDKKAQAAIICGGTNIVLPVQLAGTSHELGIHFNKGKKIGSDSVDIANLIGARIVAKWYSGFVVPDPKKIKLLCYKKEV